MRSYISYSEEDTQKFGSELAKKIKPGTVITLNGDLGAGKSVFARGIARGLGIDGPIPSPTFTILLSYEQGIMPLYHFDWYRIEDEEELYEIGVEEFLYGEGLSLVEWASNGKNLLPLNRIDITIIKQGEFQREIQLEYIGNQPSF